MTQLMVSVRNLAEAQLVAQTGIRWIDVKEPSHGSLGAAAFDVRQQIAAELAARNELYLSAAAGELIDCSGDYNSIVWHGYEFAKLGLSRARLLPDWQTRWSHWRARLPATTQPVLVHYTDGDKHQQPKLTELLAHVQQQSIRWVLLDTFDKHQGNLLDTIAWSDLVKLIAHYRTLDCQLVLAGQIRLDQLDHLLSLKPAAIAVRSAVCTRSESGTLQREQHLCPQALATWHTWFENQFSS